MKTVSVLTTRATEKTKAPIKSSKDLKTWQSACGLAIAVYRQCELFTKHEQYGLVSQMTRAAVTVCSNIAEGFDRRGAAGKGKFYAIADGSLTELENQLLIARGVGYITTEQYLDIAKRSEMTHRMLHALQRINMEWGRKHEAHN